MKMKKVLDFLCDAILVALYVSVVVCMLAAILLTVVSAYGVTKLVLQGCFNV